MARQQSVAVRLAQEDLERPAQFCHGGASGAARSYDGIADASTTLDDGTRYTLERSVADVAGLRARSARVSVSWADASGQTRQATLNSVIAGSEPAHSGALALPPSGSSVHAPLGRSVFIPLGAHDLGDGRSVLKPQGHGHAGAGVRQRQRRADRPLRGAGRIDHSHRAGPDRLRQHPCAAAQRPGAIHRR